MAATPSKLSELVGDGRTGAAITAAMGRGEQITLRRPGEGKAPGGGGRDAEGGDTGSA